MNNDNYCSKCGAKITDESAFCSKCGNRMKYEPPQQVVESIVSIPMRILTMLAIIFMPYIGLFIVIIKKPFSKKANVLWAIYCIAFSCFLFGTLYFTNINKPSDTTNANNIIQESPITEQKVIPTQEKKETPLPKETQLPSYKAMVEERVASLYKYPNDVNFCAWTAYRQWEAGGLVYVENSFKLWDSEVEHKYLARCSLPYKNELGETKATTFFYLRIDGETKYWDEDGETKYIDGK